MVSHSISIKQFHLISQTNHSNKINLDARSLVQFDAHVEDLVKIEDWINRVRSELPTSQSQIGQETFRLKLKQTGAFTLRAMFFPTEFLKTQPQIKFDKEYCRMFINFSFSPSYISQASFQQNYLHVVAFSNEGTYAIMNTSFQLVSLTNFNDLRKAFVEFLNDGELWKFLR